MQKGVRKKVNRVGLDIGTRLIKAVDVQHEGTVQKLVRFHCAEINPPSSSEKTRVALKSLLNELNPASKEVSVSLSAPSAIVRFITMPKMSDADLKTSVRFEAEKYIPFNINEVITDAVIVKGVTEDKAQMRVILAAAKKTALESKLTLLKDAGLSASIVDIDSFACFNAFCNSFDKLDEQKNRVLLNIGYSLTNVIIAKGPVPYFTRDIQISGKDIAKTIAKQLEIDEKIADTYIVDPKDKEKEVAEISKAILANLADELRLSFGYYENQYGSCIEEMYLSGGVARMRGIAEYFEEHFGVKPKLWNPFERFQMSPSVDTKSLESVRSQFAVCAGLAIR
jgi:type IV pilus assembly protein PilM